MNLRHSTLLAVVLLVPCATFVRADEKSERIAKQKAAADAKWKKMDFEKPAPPVETANLLVYSRTPETRTRALASILEKQFLAGLKALKYLGADRPWEGKLAVFIFTERAEYVQFLRAVEKKSPREEDATNFTFGEEPLLTIGVPKGAQVESEYEAKLGLASAMLKRKMGAGDPPDWVTEGFAKATEYRAANPNAKTRGPWKVPAVAVSEIWGESLTAAVKQNYAAYVIDYLAFGPLADQFPTFVGALRPDENGNAPGIDTALKAINIDVDTLTTYARAWSKPKLPVKPKK